MTNFPNLTLQIKQKVMTRCQNMISQNPLTPPLSMVDRSHQSTVREQHNQYTNAYFIDARFDLNIQHWLCYAIVKTVY